MKVTIKRLLLLDLLLMQLICRQCLSNGNPCIGAKEVCRTLENGKTAKDADVLKCLCSSKNYAHKCQLIELKLDGLAQGIEKRQLLHQ